MKSIKRTFTVAAALAVSVSSLLQVSSGTVYAVAQTCTWTGGGSDKKFSTAANWSDCGSGAPQAGDNISFDYASVTADDVYTNDLTVSLGDVTVDSSAAATTDSTKTIYISALRMVTGATLSADGYKLALGIGTGADTPAELQGDGDLTVGNGQFYMSKYNVAGKLTITSTANVSLDKNDIFGSLAVATGGVVLFEPIGETATIAYDIPVELAGDSAQGYAASFAAVCLEWGSFTCSRTGATTYTFSGAVTASTPTAFRIPENVTVNLTGTVTGSITKTADSAGTLNIGSVTVGDEVKTTVLDGDKPTESYTVAKNETAILTGTRSSITVMAGSILKGTGSTTYGIYINEGGTVAPGNSPGCLSADSVNQSGEFQVEIAGLEACTQYDQLKIAGANPVAEPVKLNPMSAMLKVTLLSGFVPTTGQSFTIIDNQTENPVSGTFKDLPEGSTFTQEGVAYKVSYVGGDGNDVVLTVGATPGVPDTGFGYAASHPAMILALMSGFAGALVVLGRRKGYIARHRK